ncbi:hypothetical protein FVA77_14890 [Phyllobacterium endophyticum]|nr:hypothetical protein FVA77_14890 [Phyllobacterium endophyticum]
MELSAWQNRAPMERMLEAVELRLFANERSVIAVNREKSGANAKNLALGVTGVVFWPALFLMDPKSPERVEIDALRNRNLVLTDIARTKNCPQPKSQLDDYYKKLKSIPSSGGRG